MKCCFGGDGGQVDDTDKEARRNVGHAQQQQQQQQGGSLLVLEDTKLVEAERALHKNLSLQIQPTLAPKDTFMINLSCLEAAAMGGSKGLDAAAINVAVAGHDVPTIAEGERWAGGDEGAAAPAGAALLKTLSMMPHPHGFYRLSTCDGPLFNCHSMPGVGGSSPSPSMKHWTQSRGALQALIASEQANGAAAAAAGAEESVSQERRLTARLERLSLVMVTMAGDGNCQFRALSYQLFGTPDHHATVRKQAINNIVLRKQEFTLFLGEDFDSYIKAMSLNGTWGDELTLRGACDSYGAVISLVTSEESNWYITYEPQRRRSKRELFLAYISPMHYNALKRGDDLRRMVRTVSNRFSMNPAAAAAAAAAAAKGGNGAAPAGDPPAAGETAAAPADASASGPESPRKAADAAQRGAIE